MGRCRKRKASTGSWAAKGRQVKVRAYRVRGISAAISFATPSASATPVAAPVGLSGRTGRASGRAIGAMPWRRQTSATQTHGFSVSRIAHFCSLLKRPAVRFLRYQAILTRRNWRPPLIEPGHSDEAGFTSPFRRRICRGDRARCAAHAAKHRSILSARHAAEVHRFDKHAPGSPKRNRTTVRAHAVAIPHPFGECRRRPRRDGNEDQGNANVQNSGACLV